MFDDLIRKWLETAERRSDLAESTKVAYARIAQHLIAWVAVGEDAASLPEYVAARRVAGTAPRTIALELRVLSVATHWAERHLGAARPPILPRVRIDPWVFVGRCDPARDAPGRVTPRGAAHRRDGGAGRRGAGAAVG